MKWWCKLLVMLRLRKREVVSPDEYGRDLPEITVARVILYPHGKKRHRKKVWWAWSKHCVVMGEPWMSRDHVLRIMSVRLNCGQVWYYDSFSKPLCKYDAVYLIKKEVTRREWKKHRQEEANRGAVQ